MDDDKRAARELAAAMRAKFEDAPLMGGAAPTWDASNAAGSPPPWARPTQVAISAQTVGTTSMVYRSGRVYGGGVWHEEAIPAPPAAIRGTYQRNEFNFHPSAVPGHAATATTVLRWRQANGNWYAVNEASGRVDARAMRAADDLWWISVGGARLDEIDGVYWTEKDAKAACEVGAAWWAEFIRD